jgi:hypothetical protein
MRQIGTTGKIRIADMRELPVVERIDRDEHQGNSCRASTANPLNEVCSAER